MAAKRMEDLGEWLWNEKAECWADPPDGDVLFYITRLRNEQGSVTGFKRLDGTWTEEDTPFLTLHRSDYDLIESLLAARYSMRKHNRG